MYRYRIPMFYKTNWVKAFLMHSKNNFFLHTETLKLQAFLFVIFYFLSGGNAFAAKSFKGYSKLPEPPATSKGESIYKESDCSMCHVPRRDGRWRRVSCCRVATQAQGLHRFSANEYGSRHGHYQCHSRWPSGNLHARSS